MKMTEEELQNYIEANRKQFNSETDKETGRSAMLDKLRKKLLKKKSLRS